MTRKPTCKDHDGNLVEVDMDEVLGMLSDDDFYCVDGCSVEADGTCPYGSQSLVLAAGLI